jgi:hypothetical protein
MHVNQIQKVSLPESHVWEITYDELYNIAPEDVPNIEGVMDQSVIWHQFFSQDLLQMKNSAKGLFIDVGWYPHADPTGFFRLLMLKYSPSSLGEEHESYHWDEPIEDFQTRNLLDLARKIESLVIQ